MDFARYVESFERLYLEAKAARVPTLPDLSSLIHFTPKKILLLAPHPDDECLISGFALRAQAEYQAQVKVVPFSFGSKTERRLERKKELSQALKILNFDSADPREKNHHDELTENEFLSSLKEFSPDTVITTHLNDGHLAHIRSAILAEKVMKKYVKDFQQKLHWLQSEFWQSMESPNLLIPLSSRDLSKMGNALLAHVGELARNPYHLTLPAWAMEQVRRGSEMQVSDSGNRISGSEKSDVVFGQIYRLEMISP